MPGCGKCGAALDIAYLQVGRRDTCPHCGAELHACIHCRHYDEAVARECKEPFAEVPQDKESANFCDFYQVGEGADRRSGPSKAALLSAVDSLFKK